MRGNLLPDEVRHKRPRSIPAHAGQPALMSETPRQVKVYPRACGATPFAQLVNGFMRGLSPRMRGNHIQYRNIRKRYRSIPAHAGQPQQAIPAPNTARVYPRACGATLSVVVVMMNGGGLSPRMRGNRIGLVDAPTLIRSIPAHAGATLKKFCLPLRAPGLSPRMRGNPYAVRRALTMLRSIPAHAGQPCAGSAASAALRVYPAHAGQPHSHVGKSHL